MTAAGARPRRHPAPRRRRVGDRAGPGEGQPRALGRAAAPGRLPRPGHGLPRRGAVRRGHRRRLRPARADLPGRGPGRGAAGQCEPGLARRRAPGADRRPQPGRTPAPGARGSRWPAGWPAARPTPPAARGLRRAVGHRPVARRTPRAGRAARQRRPFALHGGTAMGTGRGEQITPVLARGEFHWVFAFAHQGLSTPAVFRELDRLREAAGEQAVAPGVDEELLRALRAGDSTLLGAALRNDLTRPATSLRPDLRATLQAGREAGASARCSPDPARRALSRPDAVSAATVAAALEVAPSVRAVRRALVPAACAHVVLNRGANRVNPRAATEPDTRRYAFPSEGGPHGCAQARRPVTRRAVHPARADRRGRHGPGLPGPVPRRPAGGGEGIRAEYAEDERSAPVPARGAGRAHRGRDVHGAGPGRRSRRRRAVAGHRLHTRALLQRAVNEHGPLPERSARVLGPASPRRWARSTARV